MIGRRRRVARAERLLAPAQDLLEVHGGGWQEALELANGGDGLLVGRDARGVERHEVLGATDDSSARRVVAAAASRAPQEGDLLERQEVERAEEQLREDLLRRLFGVGRGDCGQLGAQDREVEGDTG